MKLKREVQARMIPIEFSWGLFDLNEIFISFKFIYLFLHKQTNIYIHERNLNVGQESAITNQ